MKLLAHVAAVLTAGAALGSAIANAAEPVKVGFVMSYSGWFQPIDAATINGALLAVKEINAAGGVLGRQIEVLKFDNKSEPPLGADGAVEVIGQGAKAILFPSDFDFGAPNFAATDDVAAMLKCPPLRKVEMSLCATTWHDDQPRSDQLVRFAGQIGAGEGHLALWF